MAKKQRKRAISQRDGLKLSSDELDEFDIWSVHAKTTDNNGHSDSPRIKFPSGVMGELKSILEHAPQYRSYQDFIRSMTINGMRLLESKLAADEVFWDNVTLMRTLEMIEDGRRDDEDLKELMQIEQLEQRMKNAKEWDKSSRVYDCLDRADALLEYGPTAKTFKARIEAVRKDAKTWLAAQ